VIIYRLQQELDITETWHGELYTVLQTTLIAIIINEFQDKISEYIKTDGALGYSAAVSSYCGNSGAVSLLLHRCSLARSVTFLVQRQSIAV